MAILQLFSLPLVLYSVLASNSNLYLIALAVLGWAVSLYFGFFRYRQYVWSRNKVRYDLFYKIDQRRANLAAKMYLFADLKTEGKPRTIRAKALLRRYLDVLGQIDFHQGQGTFDPEMLQHLQRAVTHDLTDFLHHYPALHQQIEAWEGRRQLPGPFTHHLIKELPIK